MTLEEAIKHCKDVALTCTNKECALEHFQLLKWLQEYSNMLEKQGERKSDWSEEDKNTIQVLKNIVRHSDEIDENIYTMSLKEKLYDWLKSLKHRSQWRPSEEQLRELRCVISGCSFETPLLVQLEEDLKKLLDS